MTELDKLLDSVPVEIIDARETEAQVAIRTYYVYIKAFTLKAGNFDQLKRRQNGLQTFNNLTVSKATNIDELKQPLYRGWLTLKALKLLPISEYPELATTANFWAPVQAYYAAHALGMAALVALGNSPPHKIIEHSEPPQRIKSLIV